MALPNILYATDVMKLSEEELKTMQRIENQVYRTIAQVPRHKATEGLRAEIGASSCKARDMKNKLTYTKHVLRNDNNLLREIFLDAFHNNRKQEVIKQIKLYMHKLNINLSKLENMTINDLKKK